jgi:hypothetical protein
MRSVFFLERFQPDRTGPISGLRCSPPLQGAQRLASRCRFAGGRHCRPKSLLHPHVRLRFSTRPWLLHSQAETALSNPTKTTVKPLLLVDRGFGDETVSIG